MVQIFQLLIFIVNLSDGPGARFFRLVGDFEAVKVPGAAGDVVVGTAEVVGGVFELFGEGF